MSQEKVPHVYTAIAEVIGDIAEAGGISKDHKNREQNYSYRAVDDLYGALATLLAKHKLCIIPNVLERKVETRLTRSNTNMFNVTLQIEYAFVCAVDGSSHKVIVYGEGSDTGDKATPKAMTAAFKYMCFQVFCVPVDTNDPDANTPPETMPQGQSAGPQGQSGQPRQRSTGGRTSQPQGRSAQPQSTQPPAAQTADQKASYIAELKAMVDEATDDPMLMAAAKVLYGGVDKGRVDAESVTKIARSLVAKRSPLIASGMFDNFVDMCNAFVKIGVLTDDESSVAIDDAAARLNLETKE